MERRLVTILAADAASYSRLVADDEDAALALFHQLQAVIAEQLKEHHGRVFGGAGDSLVSEFQSPVEALRCAFKIQNALADANDKLPEEKRMFFRIGLNLGDAVVVDGNLFGEAVNVAARLEGLADPGGICISGGLHEQVKHLPDFEFRDLGTRSLKNIPNQVRAYAVKGTKSRRPARRPIPLWQSAAGVGLALATLAIGWNYGPGNQSIVTASQPSIAILPLDNLSGDAKQDYFSDGLTQDITTDLSKFSNLFVVASNSAFTYKGKPTKVQDIGSTLGVRYVLEGSVERGPDKVRINAQLIDATTGHHVWAQRYDRPAGEIFAVQDEIIQTIVTSLAVKLDSAERKRLDAKEVRTADAYDLYLQARTFFYDPNKVTAQANEEIRGILEKAIALNPNDSKLYGMLSYVYIREFQNAWKDDRQESLKQAEYYAKEALKRADDFISHWSLAIVDWNQGKFDQSLQEYEEAIRGNPNDPDVAADMGEALVYGGDPERAIQEIQEAIRRNPEDTPYWYFWNLGRAFYMDKKYREALNAIAKITEPNNDLLLITAASKAQLGNLEGAKADMAEFSKNDPEWSIAKSAEYYYKKDEDRQHWLDGLRKAGLKEK
jgi:adenylate cyclase